MRSIAIEAKLGDIEPPTNQDAVDPSSRQHCICKRTVRSRPA